AEPITKVGPLTVTNSMIYGLICAVIIAAIMIAAKFSIKVEARKGFSQIIEIIIDFVLGMLEGVFGSRAKAVKYAPIFATFFMFILLSNTLGLLPVVGPGIQVTVEGVHTPLFRPFTADLNGTIAMAVMAIIYVQI